MKRAIWIFVVCISGLALAGCTKNTTSDVTLTKTQTQTTNQASPAVQQGEPMKTIADFQPIEATEVTLVTSKGDITFKLFRDDAPLTTLNFLTLAKSGFYDGQTFHRVIADFMAQVGDPLSKDPAKQAMWGSGGPGYVIADEFSPGLTHSKAGIVSMANRGPNTGGSQFFITYEATPWLDGKHAVFGEVTEGMDVLEKITVGDTIKSVSFK